MLKAVQRHGTLACFALLVLFLAVMLPGTFLTGRNIANISQQVSMLAVVAFGMTIVMSMGDFDISVGSMASLAGVLAAVVFREAGSVPLGVAAALLAGLVGGAFNGWLVAYLGVLPFVATLGTLTMFSGLAFLVSGGKTIFGADIPATFSNLAKGGIPLWRSDGQTLLIPSLTLVALAVLALSWFMLHKLAFGRHLYAMGGSSEAARLSGINVQRVKLAAFALAGVAAALAGLMTVARVASANPIQGAGLMLDAIAAVFLGMTISRHGEPRVLNTLAGVLFLGVLSNGLTQLAIDSYIRDILIGALVIAAVAATSAEKLQRN